MPVREIVGKTIGFSLVALACIAGGLLAIYGPHAANDYFLFITIPGYLPLGIILIVMGVGAGGLGAFLVGGLLLDARLRGKEEEVHVTPRPGPLGPPPPWGMRNVGRPGAPPVGHPGSTATPQGGGTPRVMSVALSRIDAPIVIGILILWTVGFCLWLAPR